MKKILVINPGSTSTKVSLFTDDILSRETALEHPLSELAQYKTIMEQKELRKNSVLKFMKENNIDIRDLSAIAARGGILPPLCSGTYTVSQSMVEYLQSECPVDHASNLAAVIAWEIAENKIPVYITDPISVDEFIDESRVSGMKEIIRKSMVHALNIKMVARKACEEIGKEYLQSNLIIAHLGGGISIAAQYKGRIIDVNNANDEGPFSPERSGELPVGDVARIAFSGKYDRRTLKKRFVGNGGLIAYLGTNDLREAFKMAQNDKNAELVIDAMAYQICKEIGAMATVLKGDVDAIVITGGLAYSQIFVEKIKNRISKLGLVMVFPGSYEMQALASGALRVLNGEEKPMEWKR